MAVKSKNESGSQKTRKRFNVRISGELEASDLAGAHNRIGEYFLALAEGEEVPPLTDGICRVTPAEGA
jgi:hypothetical protein